MSTVSPDAPASTGRLRVETGPPLRPGLREDARPRPPEVVSSVPVGCRAARSPPPPLSSPSSVPAGRRTSQAPQHSCNAGPRRAPSRRSAARVGATRAQPSLPPPRGGLRAINLHGSTARGHLRVDATQFEQNRRLVVVVVFTCFVERRSLSCRAACLHQIRAMSLRTWPPQKKCTAN